MTDSAAFTIHTDGAARGNPGPAAYAYVIERPGHPAIEEHGCLGEATNNVAEYTALVKALEHACTLGARRLIVHSDSELMVKQMHGAYKVKHDGLRPLFEEAKRLIMDFDHVSIRHVRREQNKRADALCNEALDGGARKPHKPRQKSSSGPSDDGATSVRKSAPLPASARADILDCLRAVACAWAAGNPNDPRAEEVWDQIWTILEEAGVLKAAPRS